MVDYLIRRNIIKYYKDYKIQPFRKQQEGFRRKFVLERIIHYNPKLILEIGCGFESLYHSIENFRKFIIVEPAKEFCQKEKSSSKRVKIVNGYFEEKYKELKNYKFDIIILSALLHEVPNPDLLLECIQKVCTPNTIVHINVPNAHSFHRLLALEMGLINSVSEKSDMQTKMQQSSIYSIEDLKSLLIKHKFTIIDKGSYFIKPFTHKQMQWLMDNAFFDEKMLEGFNNLIKYFPKYGSEIFVDVRIKS